MKRFLSMIIALAMLLALASFGGTALAEGTHEDAGYYNLESMIEDGEESDISFFASLGLATYLELREDGTGVFAMFGQETEITWEDGSITAEGDTAAYTLEDGVLTLDLGSEEGEALMIFREGEPAEAPAPAEPEEISDTPYGTYKLTSLEDDGEVTGEDELALMEALGLGCAIYLQEDGTGALVLFGVPVDITWNEETLITEDGEIPYTLADHVLTMAQDTASLTFTKTSDSVEIPEDNGALESLFSGMIAGEEEDGETGEREAIPSIIASEGEYAAEPLAEGDVSDVYHVAIVGAEPFTDSDGKDAVRFYYEFTNNSDEITSAWWALSFKAEQEGYELVSTYASYMDDAPEYGNEDLQVMPGATVLCVREYNFKPSGGDLTFLVSDYSGDGVFYTFTAPSDLPGRPMLWTPAPVEDPQTFLDYPLEGATDNIAVTITDAEVVNEDGEDILRVYLEVTNNTDEATSAMWLTNLRAYQDGVSLNTSYASSAETDGDYYTDIEPGSTLLVSQIWTLRSGSPVEVTVSDYTDYSTDVLCAATIDLS